MQQIILQSFDAVALILMQFTTIWALPFRLCELLISIVDNTVGAYGL